MEAIEERLTDEHGLVYRYRAHDGLEGDEGTFLSHVGLVNAAWAITRAERDRATGHDRPGE